MAFLGQFNLAEIAQYDVDGVLPKSGLLSFFYETDGEPLYAELWGLPEPERSKAVPDVLDPRSWRVRYFPEDPATFFRRLTPAAVNPDGRFPNCSVRRTTEWTIPEADSPAVQPLGLTASERFALINIDGHINGGTWEEPGIRLLGQPYNLDGSTLLQCDLAARGVHNVQWDQVTMAQERDAASRWQLLLQLRGGQEIPYNWGGSGVLHFCIERAALAVRDFQRTWLNMQLV